MGLGTRPAFGKTGDCVGALAHILTVMPSFAAAFMALSIWADVGMG